MGVEKWFQLENFVEFRNSPIINSCYLDFIPRPIHSRGRYSTGNKVAQSNNWTGCIFGRRTGQDSEKLESQSSSQSSEHVNYGTQPDARVQNFEDYDWDQDRKLKYRRNDKGGFDRLEFCDFYYHSCRNKSVLQLG